MSESPRPPLTADTGTLREYQRLPGPVIASKSKRWAYTSDGMKGKHINLASDPEYSGRVHYLGENSPGVALLEWGELRIKDRTLRPGHCNLYTFPKVGWQTTEEDPSTPTLAPAKPSRRSEERHLERKLQRQTTLSALPA